MLAARRAALRQLDLQASHYDSTENPAVQALYANTLHAPGSPLAESLLHTEYVPGGAAAVQDEGVRAQATTCGQVVRDASALAPPPLPAWCVAGQVSEPAAGFVEDARRECEECRVLEHTCESGLCDDGGLCDDDHGADDECCYCF